MVLKTGLDRSVKPLTGELSGSVRFNELFVVKPALNRSNRRLNRRTGQTVCYAISNCLMTLVYTGEWLRHFMPVKERMMSAEADRLGQVSISNATRRRLAGSGM
uniref:Uncharacterized protein n=1 Tax=Vitis vinifera TaxID=29760 RepID=A5CBP1_VITVI|nr:hypothetical protein VITISV_017314 [Vitis vinifera]